MFDKVVDLFFSPVVQMVLMALLGVLFAGFKKYKNLYDEFIDIPRKLRESKEKNSNGGIEITEAEWVAIGKESVEFIDAAAKVDWKTIFKSIFKRK